MPLPTPKNGEDKKTFISRCVAFAKKEDKMMNDDQAAAMCANHYGEHKPQSLTMQKLDFSVPISESVKINDEFLIRGIAINETVTRNGTRFIAAELEKSAKSLKNKPILKDHNNSVDSIIGRTTDNVHYDPLNHNIPFEARIVDEAIQKKIEQGLITAVSVGAMVKNLEESTGEDEGTYYTAKGIDFVELSLVAVPADPHAGFTKAVAEAFNPSRNATKEGCHVLTSADLNNVTEEKIMVEENKNTLQELKAKQEKMMEEIETLKLAKMEAEKAELSAELDKKKKKEMTVGPTIKNETRGVIASTEEDAAPRDFVVESAESGKGFRIWRENYDSQKYKKLARY